MDTADVEMSAADMQLVQHHRRRIAAEFEEWKREKTSVIQSQLMCKELSHLDAKRNAKRNHEEDIKWMIEYQRREIQELETTHEKEVNELEETLKKDLTVEMRIFQWSQEENLPPRVRELMDAIPIFDSEEVESEPSAPDADVLELAGFADTQVIREEADAAVETDAVEDSEEEELDESTEFSSDSEDADGSADESEEADDRDVADSRQPGNPSENVVSRMMRDLAELYRERLEVPSPGEIDRYLADLHERLSASTQRDTHDDIENSDEENPMDDNALDHSFGSATTEIVTDEDEDEVDAEAAAAAVAATRETIKTLREQNEECTTSGYSFSRICPICSDSPLQRAVFTSCGHSICLACAEEIKLVAEESEEIELACPMCREEGGFVKLWEDRLDQD